MSAASGPSSGSPKSASSCSIRSTVQWCHSTSRCQLRDLASSMSPSSRVRRRRRRGAYSEVVTNLAYERYRSHSHGSSCGRGQHIIPCFLYAKSLERLRETLQSHCCCRRTLSLTLGWRHPVLLKNALVFYPFKSLGSFSSPSRTKGRFRYADPIKCSFNRENLPVYGPRQGHRSDCWADDLGHLYVLLKSDQETLSKLTAGAKPAHPVLYDPEIH